MAINSGTVAAHSLSADTYVYDQIDAAGPRLLVTTDARRAKAELVVRTAYEMFAPDLYAANMTRWVRDVDALAIAYSVTPLKVSEVVRAAAEGLIAVWRAEAGA